MCHYTGKTKKIGWAGEEKAAWTSARTGATKAITLPRLISRYDGDAHQTDGCREDDTKTGGASGVVAPCAWATNAVP